MCILPVNKEYSLDKTKKISSKRRHKDPCIRDDTDSTPRMDNCQQEKKLWEKEWIQFNPETRGEKNESDLLEFFQTGNDHI